MKYNLKNNYVFNIIVAAILITVCCETVQADMCDQEELLRCAYPIKHLTSGSSVFFEKKEELDEFCPILNTGLLCIDNYTRRCMTSEKRNHFNRLYSGTSMVIKDMCREGPYQEEFLRHAPCMRLVRREYEICATHYTQMIQDVNSPSRNGSNAQLDGDAQTRTVCCSFQDYLTCSENIVMRQCGVETWKFTQGFLERMSSSLLKDHCRTYLPSCLDAISGAFNSSHLHMSSWFLVLIFAAIICIHVTTNLM